MELFLNKDALHYRLQLSGQFTFSDNAKFRDVLAILREEHPASVTLEIDKLQFIDSAALGMLLLLHDEAKKKNLRVEIRGAGGQIKKMLQLSNFDEIFTIHYAQDIPG